MAINDIVQTIAEARVDARSLSEFVFKPAGFKVTRRLAPTIDTLQFYIDRLNALDGDFSSSVSAALSSLNSSVAEADGKVAYIETTVQDAINNTAIEGGILADTFVVVDATLNQRQINRGLESIADLSTINNPKDGLRVYVKSYHAGLNKGGGYFTYDSSKAAVNDGGLIINGWVREDLNVVSVKDFGAVGDSTIDDTKAIQDNIDWTETNKIPYVFIPTTTENYLINEPLKFTESGIKIFGTKGATYNRGTGKNGYLLLGEGVTHGLDLGNYKTRAGDPTPLDFNVADAYTVANVGITSYDGVRRAQDGIRYTAKNNGPDRGGVIREVSIQRMENAIHLPDLGTEIVYATLHIENCCLNSNGYSLYAEGQIGGLRFVANQAEHNAKGAVWGTFSGGVLIADNMLEGQANPINIWSPPNGSNPSVIIRGNYFEAHGMGDYLIQFDCSTTTGSITVEDNYAQKIDGPVGTKPSNDSVDFLRIKNNSFVQVINKDAATTFVAGAILNTDSSLFSKVDYYRVRDFRLNSVGPMMLLDESTSKQLQRRSSNNYSNALISSDSAEITPWGKCEVVKDGAWVAVRDLQVNEGDVFTVDMILRAESLEVSTSATLQCYSGGTSLAERTVNIAGLSNGRWLHVHACFKSKATSGSTVTVRFYSPTAPEGYLSIAGLSVTNYGPIDVQTNTVKNITPIRPPISPVSYLHKIPYTLDAFEVTEGQTLVNIIDAASYDLTYDNKLDVKFMTQKKGLIVWADITGTTISLYLHNPTSTPVSFSGATNVDILVS